MDNALGPQVRVFGTGGHKELQDFLYTCSLSVQLNSCSFKLKHAGEEVKSRYMELCITLLLVNRSYSACRISELAELLSSAAKIKSATMSIIHVISHLL